MAVSDYFGGTSDEATAADTYFLGFDNSTKKPASVLISQYPSSAVSAWLRGGPLGLTLAQVKALTAFTLTVVSNGTSNTSGSIVLSGATSYSDAAAIMLAAFTLPVFTITYDSIPGAFVFTSTTTGVNSTMDYVKSIDATATACTSLSTVLTIGGTITGSFQVGDVVSGTDSTHSLPAGCTIVNQLTGTTGLAGTYTISAAATPSNLSSCAVTSRGYSGAMDTTLKLNAATGAILSQGAAASTPSTAMDLVVARTTNWATFTTLFNPDATGNTNKMLFTDWCNDQGNRYAYLGWDPDITPTQSTNASTSMGQLLIANGGSGTSLLYAPTVEKAVMVCGMGASIDFEEKNGRINFAFRSQSGMTADVTDETIANNLLANGYNFYGTYATGNDQFTFLYNGSISGQYKWLNTYLYQIWMNNAFQLALMSMLTTMKSIPYNASGYAVIRAWLMDPINAALNFGSIQPGVTLSAGQISAVNSSAGLAIDETLSKQGWYLQILDATAQVRGNRGTPPMKFFYMDGGDVNEINLASIEVQ